ncbi:MAG: hypothetical protein ACOC1F_07935 [Myxococcota bacterium]
MKTLPFIAASCALGWLGCAPASAPPPTAETPPPAAAHADDQEPPLLYSKFTDPLYLAFSDEQNVYGRRTLARLWVAVASTDPPSDAQESRLATASEALERTERAAAAQPDPCEAGVTTALERAIQTKNRLEQQYLDVTEQAGESSPTAKRLDAQVHLLRDEIEALRALSEPCPTPMFDQPNDSL